MYFSLIILCTFSTLFSEAAILDYSNITPWSIVYLVYPIYDTDPWTEFLKSEKSLDNFDNSAVLEAKDGNQSNDFHKEITDDNDSPQDRISDHKNNQNLKINQQTQILSWPPNYRNWPKNSNKPEH